VVIDINSPFRLQSAQIDSFRERGFVKLKHVLSREAITYYGAEIARLTLELNTQTAPLAERNTYDKAFLQVANLWRSSALVREFVMGQKLGRIAAQLLSVNGVRLYHDQALYKEPGGGITPAHADQYYWPFATDRSITAWIPLQEVPRTMGPLEFFAGSHKTEIGRDLPISDDSERTVTAAMERQRFNIVAEPFELGDVSFHRGWTFHRAGPNTSAQPRAVMTMIYMDQQMRFAETLNSVQQRDGSDWCPGIRPGQLVDTSLNPVVYSE
jgi:ectoine hydroxylase-related dioxygenase (phytanoyl-CoA dioxygenase family)